MNDFNLRKYLVENKITANSKKLNENVQEKYQVVFHDYDGDDVPYTEQLFNSEGDAERWVTDQKSYSDNYDDVDYYNPEDRESYFGYHIEKVGV